MKFNKKEWETLEKAISLGKSRSFIEGFFTGVVVIAVITIIYIKIT